MHALGVGWRSVAQQPCSRLVGLAEILCCNVVDLASAQKVGWSVFLEEVEQWQSRGGFFPWQGLVHNGDVRESDNFVLSSSDNLPVMHSKQKIMNARRR